MGWRRTTGWLNKGIFITRQDLTEAAEQQFALLAHQNYLQHLQESAFTTQLAELWGEIHAVHSFREGNTRTQSLFFNWQRKQVIHFHCIDQGKNHYVQNLLTHDSQITGSNDQLATVLRKAINPFESNMDPVRTNPENKEYIIHRLSERFEY